MGNRRCEYSVAAASEQSADNRAEQRAGDDHDDEPGIASRHEVVDGHALAVGEAIWGWVIDLVPSGHRDDARAIGDRAWATLGGYLRGVTLV